MRKIHLYGYYASSNTDDTQTQSVAMTREEVESVLRKRVKKAEKRAREAQQALDAFLALEGGAA